MKKITVKMVKGNSTIYASIGTHDRSGAYTDDECKASGYLVDGACGSIQSYKISEKGDAFASFYYKIGMKTIDGYSAVRV